MQHTAKCLSDTTVWCGSVNADSYQRFIDTVQTRVAAFATDHSGGQGKVGKGLGLQRTPAFILARVMDALQLQATLQQQQEPALSMERVCGSASNAGLVHLPRGGFTDVGRHTGSSRRDTCWPLVKGVIKVNADL